MNPQEIVFNPRVLSSNPKVLVVYPRVYNPRHISTEAYRVMSAIDWCTKQFATHKQQKNQPSKKGWLPIHMLVFKPLVQLNFTVFLVVVLKAFYQCVQVFQLVRVIYD